LTYDNFERDEDSFTGGYDPEQSIATAIEQSKNVQTCDLESSVLVEAIQGSPVGRKYLRLAEPFLICEFAADSIDKLGRKVYTLPSLDTLPSVTLLDYVLGLKYSVTLSACQIGIDVAFSLEQSGKKLRQKRELESVYSILKFDRIVILCLTTDFTPQTLESQLKTVVKFNNLIQIINL
jgi:hypothetical protein